MYNKLQMEQIDVEGIYISRCELKLAMAEMFKMHWHGNLNTVTCNPILQTYTNLKFEFHSEPYLSLGTNYEYRNANTKLKGSSHTLKTKRGRYTSSQTPLDHKLFSVCVLIGYQVHFLVGCRHTLKNKIINLFLNLSKWMKLINLFSCYVFQIQTYLP